MDGEVVGSPGVKLKRAGCISGVLQRIKKINYDDL